MNGLRKNRQLHRNDQFYVHTLDYLQQKYKGGECKDSTMIGKVYGKQSFIFSVHNTSTNKAGFITPGNTKQLHVYTLVSSLVISFIKYTLIKM